VSLGKKRMSRHPTEGVSEHGVEENIWTSEGRGNGGMGEIA